MAVTFTSKAAEMRHHIQSTSKHAQHQLVGMWIGTFHSITSIVYYELII